MNTANVPDFAKDFAKMVDEVLYYIWDPIGDDIIRSAYPYARNEYAMYVGEICNAVVSGATQDELASLLDGFVTESMEMKSMKVKCTEVAALILKCYKFLLDEPEMAHGVMTGYEAYCEPFYLRQMKAKYDEDLRLAKENGYEWPTRPQELQD